MKRWLILIGLGVALIVVLTLGASGWLERHPAAGGMIGATILFVILVGLAAVMFYLGAAWTERQVKLGASIATNAQQIDRRTDERKTVALAHLAREMFRLGQKESHGNEISPPQPLPALPERSGETPDWIVPLTPFGPSSPTEQE